MGEFFGSIFVVLTIMMWVDVILSFISKSFNNSLIESLKEQNKFIDDSRNEIKKLFRKISKK